MATQYHIAQKGKNAGKLVPCYANVCTIGNIPLTHGPSGLNLDDAVKPTHKIDFYSLAEEYAITGADEEKAAVAGDSRTSGRLLAAIANSTSNEFVLNLVAKNPNTPESVLRQLMDSRYDVNVHQGIAENWNAPADLLARLEDYDRDSIVRERAQQMIYLRENPTHPEAIALNPNSTAEQLDAVKDTPAGFETNVPYLVAKHPNASVETVRHLANDLRGGAYGAAMNPNTPKDVLKKLSKSDKDNIRTSVFFNPAFSDEERKDIKYYQDPEVIGYISPLYYKTAEASRTLAQTEF